MFPKLGPRHKDEKKTDFEAEENEGDCKKAIHWRFGNFRDAPEFRGASLKGLSSSLGGGFDFFNSCSLAAQLSDVIQLRTAYASGADYFNLVDDLRM